MSLEVKCIFLHSGLLLSKIYFIKQTFVIKECAVFTCGAVSNEINHFHLISLCTDSYLTFHLGPVSSPRLVRGEGGPVGTGFLPAHHTPLKGVIPKTQIQSRVQDAGSGRSSHQRAAAGTDLLPWPGASDGASRERWARPGGAGRRCWHPPPDDRTAGIACPAA